MGWGGEQGVEGNREIESKDRKKKMAECLCYGLP